MDTSIDVVSKFLENTTNPDVMRGLIAPDAVYISLNFDNPDLHRIMPWAGTKKGVEAYIDNFAMLWSCWEKQSFEIQDMFGADDKVAVFGKFIYRSYTLNKFVTTPFAIFAKVKDGLIYYFQFMEDTFATAASFRISSAGEFHSNPKEEPFTL